MIGPRRVDKPLVVLYGFGKLGHLAEEIFKELGTQCFKTDANINIALTPDIVPFDKKKALLAICVATEPYLQVIKPLVAVGWKDIVPVYDIIEAYPEIGIHNGWFAGPLTPEDRYGISCVALGFADRISAIHYYAHLEWRRYREDLAYEIEPKESLPSTLADIRQRQRVITFADTPMMKAVSIHNEGCELFTLRENIRIFQDHRPSIEVAVYHSRDGLWAIEKYLMDSLQDYRWTFRLYAYQGQAAFIYGCPKEKL